MRDRRGVSEIIGLVIIFGVVVSAIGLVAATGFAGLQDARAVQENNNGVRAFEVLDQHVDDLVYGRAPARATEVDLANTQLTLGDPVTITVRGERLTDGHTFAFDLDTVPIEYDLRGDTRLVYVGGSVIRVERSGAVQLRRPPIPQAGDDAVVPIIAFRATPGDGIGGDRTVRLRTRLAATDLLVSDPAPHRLEIQFVAHDPAIRETYLDGFPCDEVVASGPNAVVCVIDRVESVSVTAIRIDVGLE